MSWDDLLSARRGSCVSKRWWGKPEPVSAPCLMMCFHFCCATRWQGKSSVDILKCIEKKNKLTNIHWELLASGISLTDINYKTQKKKKNVDNVTETWGSNNSIESVWSGTHEPPSAHYLTQKYGPTRTTSLWNRGQGVPTKPYRTQRSQRPPKHVSSDTTTTVDIIIR